MVGLDIYTRIITRFKATGASPDVTHYVLSLGAQSATPPYHYAKTYAAGATIEMPVFTKAAAREIHEPGVHVRYDAIAFTTTAVAEGDKIKLADDTMYLIESVRKETVGDQLINYSAQLSLLPLE